MPDDQSLTTEITWIEFAAHANDIAAIASSWARDGIMPGGADRVPVERLDVFSW